MTKLICPKCKETLEKTEKSLVCRNRHCYDIAKEGYVNLLPSSKNGSLIGDNRDMALSRRDFLNKGYFSALAEALGVELKKAEAVSPCVLDICCGEGYYSSFLKKSYHGDFLGFDISKEMIRLAAKRKSGVSYFVANMTDIPLSDESVDFAIHLFAPFFENEFYRILKKGGTLVSVTPGKEHLFSLKKVLYDTPYLNDETPPETEKLTLVEQKKVFAEIKLQSEDDIQALFKMTPYYYHTSDENKNRLIGTNSLKTEIDFTLNIYKK